MGTLLQLECRVFGGKECSESKFGDIELVDEALIAIGRNCTFMNQGIGSH